jgi:hypothetical protein
MKYFIRFAIALAVLSPSFGFAEEDKPPDTKGRAGGSRGCEIASTSKDSMPALLLLTPQQPHSKTADPHPAFAWFVRDDAPQPMIFRLYQYEPNQQSLKRIWEKQGSTFMSQAGISFFSLPNDAPALAIGQRYLWQVELVCHPNRPSSNLFAEAEFQVIAPQTKTESWHNTLKMVLNTKDRRAIALLFQQVTSNPTEQQRLQQSPIHRIP